MKYFISFFFLLLFTFSCTDIDNYGDFKGNRVHESELENYYLKTSIHTILADAQQSDSTTMQDDESTQSMNDPEEEQDSCDRYDIPCKLDILHDTYANDTIDDVPEDCLFCLKAGKNRITFGSQTEKATVELLDMNGNVVEEYELKNNADQKQDCPNRQEITISEQAADKAEKVKITKTENGNTYSYTFANDFTTTKKIE